MTDPASAPRTSRRWVLVATILASAMGFIDFSALGVVLPTIQEALRASGSDVLWIGNMSPLILSSLMLVGGSFGDRFGRKRVFMIGIVLFAAGSSLSGLAPNVPLLLVARGIQGLGGAFMIPGSLAMITSVYPPSERGQAIGTWSALTTITTAVGPVLAGFLAGSGHWRLVFFISLPLAIAALLLLAWKSPEVRDEEAAHELDLPGAALITLCLAGLAYGFTEAPRLGFGHPAILTALTIGVAALGLFVVVEARRSHPLVPLSIFRSRTFSGANVLTLLLYGALSGVFFFVPLNLIQLQGYPPAVVGLTFLPFVVILAMLSRWAGSLVDRYGPRLPLTIGPALTGLGMLLFLRLGITNGPSAYWSTVFPAIAVVGLGMGITVASLSTAVMGSVTEHHAGLASGINNAVSRSSGVIAIACLGAIALFSFQSSLSRQTAGLAISPTARTTLAAEARKFGAARAPAGVTARDAERIQEAIRLSFVRAFHQVALVTGLTGLLGAALAYLMIEGKLRPGPT